MRGRRLICLLLLVASAPLVQAQEASQRGFVEGAIAAFPQAAVTDRVQAVGDARFRDELFVTPATWLRVAGGFDLRADSHDRVDTSWTPDFRDRGAQRPRLSVRRLNATVTRGPLTVDAGKQFIRWGKADIVNPTDRFAPRDFLDVVDSEFLAVTGVHATVQAGSHTFEGVWTPRFTPSRSPLLDQRWAVVPPAATGIPIVEVAPQLPDRRQVGARWGHVGEGFEYSVSVFDGVNHLPDIQSTPVFATPGSRLPTAIEVARVHPRIRTYGGDLAWPMRWFTVKAEAAYFTSPSALTDEYGLYVIQLERQSGEWLFVGGYAGEVDTRRRSQATFAPDRGTSRSIVGRASYTIDTNRSVGFEGAVHQDGRGAYGKAEYSQARGPHWRATVTAIGVGGRDDDFFGQYRRNSHVKVTLRYSF
ncbi:MAG: hypothetical protein ABIX28_02925 [Vicinamibacterales bacterium]